MPFTLPPRMKRLFTMGHGSDEWDGRFRVAAHELEKDLPKRLRLQREVERFQHGAADVLAATERVRELLRDAVAVEEKLGRQQQHVTSPGAADDSLESLRGRVLMAATAAEQQFRTTRGQAGAQVRTGTHVQVPGGTAVVTLAD